MATGKSKKQMKSTARDPADSLWLSQPPTNPSQVLSNISFQLAIQQRYGIDTLADRRFKCPYCRCDLDIKHCIACTRANLGPIIARHNTISRMIGHALASEGTPAEYEKKILYFGKDKKKEPDHRPDVTYKMDTSEHYIDVTVCSVREKGDYLKRAIQIKKNQYITKDGTILRNLHIVAFDNAGNMGAGVNSYLHSIGCTNALIKAMQVCILQANEKCYKKVMCKVAEDLNTSRVRGTRNLMTSPNQIDDMLSLY